MINLLSALPWLIAAFGLIAGGGGTLWYRSEYHECTAAREADRTAAERAKNAAVAKAQATSDAIITEQARALAETAAKVGGIRERIISVPITTACASSPAVRAAIDGLRSITGSPSGSDPQAVGGPPAALPAPGRR
jgi:hypothetical protein